MTWAAAAPIKTKIFRRHRLTLSARSQGQTTMKTHQKKLNNNFSKKLAEKRYETFFDMFSWLVWPRLPRYDDQNILF